MTRCATPRKKPVTEKHHPSASSSTTRTLIRHFHVLLKKQWQLQKNAPNTKASQEVEQEIEELGGLAAYQRMSNIGQGADRGGGSEKVLIDWLIGLGWSKRPDRLRLLEVGALKPDNYASCSSWITTTAIDLRSRHPSILEQDFLAMDVNEHAGHWDIVSLSLVVNFVPEPTERGRMLVLAHTLLRPSGVLFLVLPSPCVDNSRYMSSERLASLMRTIGFATLEKRQRRGGKMAYWLYQKTEPSTSDVDEFCRKRVCREGKRNNFCILLAA